MAVSDKSEPVTRSGELVAACREDIPVLTERLITAIFTENPEWTDYSAVSRADLQEGCHRFLTRVLDLIDEKGLDAEHDDVAAAIGAHRAVQGVPLEAMLRTFRLGGRIIWEALVDRAGTISAADFREMGTAMWAVIDGMSSALVTSYRGAELDRVRLDERRRHALIEDLLAGRGRDARFAHRASRELNIPVTSAYLVITARGDTYPLRLGTETALAAQGFRSVWHNRGDSTVGLIALENNPSAQVTAVLGPLVSGRAGLSPAVIGLAEVDVAHMLAALALDTMPEDSHGVLTSLHDRYPEALLLRSPDLAQLLVGRLLGPILELPAKERDLLLTTLRVWLAEDCSAAHAAPLLYCHRNTVLNRLQRAAILLGRPLDGQRFHLELSLALLAHTLVETATD
ncbi:PucR family transcriptional regulator [Nocardia sienata]|uniref:PucR family transcriptional regulator n=1 Tax=Nocardia sienata TaxID=248552 RepID=UPI00157DDDC8|nr:helix-turn-helix domain-containing protein [Nocardia sienata]